MKDDAIRRKLVLDMLKDRLEAAQKGKSECRRFSAGWHREQSIQLELEELIRLIRHLPAHQEPETS